MDITAIVLAAGDGKRMVSNKPKAMCEVLGEPMIDWVLDGIAGAGISAENTGIVTGFASDVLNKHLAGRNGAYRIFTQSERKGTAHAAAQAADMLRSGENVLIVCGDTPFVDGETIRSALKAHTESGNAVTAVTADLPDPARYDRVICADDGSLEAVVPAVRCTLPQLGTTEVTGGTYLFRADALAAALPTITADSADGEICLADAVAAVRKAGGKAGKYTAKRRDAVLGADNRTELLQLNILAKMSVIGKHLENGVDVVSTDGVIIGRNVVIGKDTQILPGTILRGNTVIGESCVLGPNTLIENCKIGNGVTLNSVQAYDSRVCDRVKAGPFVQLRPGTILHDGVKIGDFVEVKNSEIGVNTAISHLTYVGDSDVGKGVNFGCGCVTANYDGINKYRTKIGDYAFIGCNTNLIAPVEIGENATTAAGSTITKSVPPDSLAVERAQTKIIDHWEKNFLRKKKA